MKIFWSLHKHQLLPFDVCSTRKRCNLTYVSQLFRLFPWLSYAFPIKRLLPKLRTEKNGVEYDDTSYNPLRAPHRTL